MNVERKRVMEQASRLLSGAGALPTVTSQERDFWRRAVAAERERLARLARGAADSPRPDTR